MCKQEQTLPLIDDGQLTKKVKKGEGQRNIASKTGESRSNLNRWREALKKLGFGTLQQLDELVQQARNDEVVGTMPFRRYKKK